MKSTFYFFILSQLAVAQADSEPFIVTDIYPGNKTQAVELEPLIQIHVSEKFDPASVNGKAVVLSRRGGGRVATNVGGDLGGVVTLSVNEPLERNTEYELSVTAALRSVSQQSIKPLKIRFRTTDQAPKPPRSDIADFRFTKVRIDRRDGVCGLALFKQTLFACTWDGRLLQYSLSESGEVRGDVALLLSRKRRFNAMTVDPSSTGERTVLWLSHDSQYGLSLGPNDFSGTIARVVVKGGVAEMQDVITGLPTGDHPASGLTFGPAGWLFVSQGALSMLGGKPKVPETPLSAATLAINLDHKLWQSDLPVDVRDFKAETAPKAIRVFATGIREAFDLCWHSSGSLFAGVNMNDTGEKTPDRDGLPAVSSRPAEMMLRIVEGKYYGHPNPSRNEWVLLGGNPTSKIDPWEVSELPVGTAPDSNFDPALLIRDLEKDKGPSADGVCEWTGAGPLQGRLFFCFYTATRGLHSYLVTDGGKSVADAQPLVNGNDSILRFGAPLDVVHDPRGWFYVSDFSAPSRGDSGKSGGVWLVKPAHDSHTVFRDDFGRGSRGERVRNTISDPEPDGLAYKSDTPFGFQLKKWIVADPHAAGSRRSFWCIPERADGRQEPYAQQAGRSKNSIAYAGVPLPQSARRYTVKFRQWCNDNDYVGFILGAPSPVADHGGIEFGYTRQIPGTDTTSKDAYVSGDLGEALVPGQALRQRWVNHRIEVDGANVRWFQNDELIIASKVSQLASGGYFGIRHRFERGTRYDDVVITGDSDE